MTNIGKFIAKFLLAFISVLIFSKPAFALVIAAPIVIVSAVKLAALLVTTLAVPLTWLIHQIRGNSKAKTLAISAAILLVIFALTFLVLKLVSNLTGQPLNTSSSGLDIGGPVETKRMPVESSGNIVPLDDTSEKPYIDYAPGTTDFMPPVTREKIPQGTGARPTIYSLYDLYSGIGGPIITFVILLIVFTVPIMVIGLIINNTLQNKATLTKVLGICTALSFIISVLITFMLFIAYMVLSGKMGII